MICEFTLPAPVLITRLDIGSSINYLLKYEINKHMKKVIYKKYVQILRILYFFCRYSLEIDLISNWPDIRHRPGTEFFRLDIRSKISGRSDIRFIPSINWF